MTFSIYLYDIQAEWRRESFFLLDTTYYILTWEIKANKILQILFESPISQQIELKAWDILSQNFKENYRMETFSITAKSV